MYKFTTENEKTKYDKVKCFTQGLSGKSSGCYDGESYYYDHYKNKYYHINSDYTIYEISKKMYDSIQNNKNAFIF